MSFSTWKKEFYPVKAKTIAKKGSEVDIVQHSLTKWIGLRPENLDKHEMRLHGYHSITDVPAGDLLEGDWPYSDKTVLSITDESCSLCKAYRHDDMVWHVDACERCPLYIVRKNTPCTSRQKGQESVSPYGMFTGSGDPEPMIADLRRALQRAKRRAKKEKPKV